MEKKYWVPALEKAYLVLETVAEEPNQLRLIDLSKRLGIHKSSLFSLLATLEALNCVVRDRADTYALGSWFGKMGGSYFSRNDMAASFHREAEVSKTIIGETIQLARLDGNEVLYLAKSEAPTRIRLVSEPGMKLPAHATALGKAMLAQLPLEALTRLYADAALAGLTPNTLTDRKALFTELEQVRKQGFAVESQEAVVGFCCAAAPVLGAGGEIAAAVSCSMPVHEWERKRDAAVKEIVRLARRLTLHI
jgi:DNA-binding IclR family transcriptional regulator